MSLSTPAPKILPSKITPETLLMDPRWFQVKDACARIAEHQLQDGSLSDSAPEHEVARAAESLASALDSWAQTLVHDAEYLKRAAEDTRRWARGGFGVPDFLSALSAFHPAQDRTDGLIHLVVFPMYTQNGSRERKFEAVLFQVLWPDFIAELESSVYSNSLFLPIRFIDFTSGYETNSAVLFPESVATSSTPTFTWGAIFADREAARYRAVIDQAAKITGLDLPEPARLMLEDQEVAEKTFILWDLIHDRTHMRGELPFDPFMIKQRMPYFLYGLEELRCDLTAYHECVRLAQDEGSSEEIRRYAQRVQFAVIFDRIFRFAISGTRQRNYDGLGGQLLFAWMHQHRVLNWRDGTLEILWDKVPDVVMALGAQIEELYWRSIDRPKISHWLAAYDMLSRTLTAHPASQWARGADALPTTAPLGAMTDAVLEDEFPLSMFYEALSKKMKGTIDQTQGIVGKAYNTQHRLAEHLIESASNS